MIFFKPIDAQIAKLSAQLAAAKKSAGAGNAALGAQIDALGKKLNEVAGNKDAALGAPLSLAVLGKVQTLFGGLQEVDAAPTFQLEAATGDVFRDADAAVKAWRAIESDDIPALNKGLKAAGIAEVKTR